jgi:hypothetical protein
VDQGQKGELEGCLAIAFGNAEERAVADDAFMDNRLECRRERVSVLERPKAQEIHAAQFTSELLAHLRAGQTETEGIKCAAFGDERLPQQTGDLRWVDLKALRRDPPIADPIPIRVKLRGGFLLHRVLNTIRFECLLPRTESL